MVVEGHPRSLLQAVEIVLLNSFNKPDESKRAHGTSPSVLSSAGDSFAVGHPSRG